MDKREVGGDFIWSRGLEEQVRACRGRLRDGVGSCSQGVLRNYGCCSRCRSIQILKEGPPKRDYGCGRIDGDSREQGKVFAAVGKCPQMGNCRMGEKY